MTTDAHEDLRKVLDAHAKWLRREDGGSRADLSWADLSLADLSGADLSRANLSRANLSWADLSGANLSGADLSWANLSGAKLSGANLSRANLSRVNLSWAILMQADLSGADLSGAKLSWANLSWANLSGADLSGAKLSGANLSGADLSEGVTWEEYLRDIVPALLTAGGRALPDVATPETWACHSWTNCPMATAFGVDALESVPALHRWQAQRFVQFFDAGLIPLPTVDAQREAP